MNNTTLRRIALFLLAAVTISLSWYAPATDRARVQVQAGLERSLTAFAAARALGAVVSVAQGTVVDLQPGGVGVSLAPGQALQPLDQLIDQFANVMLAASVSFGIQLLLLEIGTYWMVSGALTVVLVAFVSLRLAGTIAAARWLRPALIVLLVVRFAVPACALGNEAVYQVFMADGYQTNLATLRPTSASLLATKEPDTPSADGWLARIQQWKRSVPDLKSQYDALLRSASAWSRSIVQLIALFIVQTIVFPLVFLALVWRFSKMLAGAKSHE